MDCYSDEDDDQRQVIKREHIRLNNRKSEFILKISQVDYSNYKRKLDQLIDEYIKLSGEIGSWDRYDITDPMKSLYQRLKINNIGFLVEEASLYIRELEYYILMETGWNIKSEISVMSDFQNKIITILLEDKNYGNDNNTYKLNSNYNSLKEESIDDISKEESEQSNILLKLKKYTKNYIKNLNSNLLLTEISNKTEEKIYSIFDSNKKSEKNSSSYENYTTKMIKVELKLVPLTNLLEAENLHVKSKFSLKDYSLSVENLINLEKNLNYHLEKTVRCDSLLEEAYGWIYKSLNAKPELFSRIRDIAPFGSVTQFTHNKFSDLDVSIITTDKTDFSLLNDISSYLYLLKYNKAKQFLSQSENSSVSTYNTKSTDEEESLYEVGELYSAKTIPLLSITYKKRIKIELSLNNCLGVYNSQLIRMYSLFDARVSMLANLVKDWTKEYKINGNYQHFLSSFSYTLLVLFFLVQKDIVPPFSFIEDNKIRIDFTHHSTWGNGIDQEKSYGELIIPNCNDLKRIFNNFESSNDQSIAELFTEFLIYYGCIFNPKLFYVDIRSREINYRSLLEVNNFGNKKKTYNNLFNLVDPFDLNYNPGSYLNEGYSQENDFYNTIYSTLDMIAKSRNIFS